MAGTPPSHIVLPAIHLKKEDVGQLFHEHLGTAAGATDPKYLAEVARGHLRDKFMQADAGITGVNFAVAETGGLVVCTNEGNADLGVSLPKLHIASMGIEKLIPRAKDLGVFLRLLARSATGQPITTYSSHFHGPRPGGELHIVLVDNGRSRAVGQRRFSPLAALHPLRSLHEHLPGLSAQRRLQLSKHGAGPDRIDPGAGPRSGEVSQPAVCVQLVRFVHGRLSGEDRFAPPVAHLAGRDRPRRPFAAEQAGRR